MGGKSVFALLSLTGILLFGSCSSTPKGEEPVTAKRAQANSLSDIGLRYFGEGSYQEALTFFSFALREQVLADHREGIIDSYYNIGRAYLELGKNEEAFQAFQEGLRLAQIHNQQRRQGRGKILLGEYYLNQHNLEEGEKLFFEALDLLLPLQEEGQKELAVVYHDLGLVHHRKGALQAAEEYVRQSLALNRTLKTREELSNNLYVLASLLHSQSRHQEAYDLLQEALEIDRFLERSLSLAQTLFALGSVAEKLERPQEAYTSYGQSFMIYQTMGVSDQAARALQRLAKMAEQEGDLDKLERYQRAATILEDSP